jgi:hypothetical protein
VCCALIKQDGFYSEQRIFVKLHHFAIKMYVLCQEALQNETVSTKTTIHRLNSKFCEAGSVCVIGNAAVVLQSLSDDTPEDVMRLSSLH